MCASLYDYPEEKTKIFVCLLAQCLYLHSLSKQNDINFQVLGHTPGVHLYVCVRWDGITLRVGGCICLRSVVCVCRLYQEKTIPPHTQDKHNRGNKSGHRCHVLSKMVSLEMSLSPSPSS